MTGITNLERRGTKWGTLRIHLRSRHEGAWVSAGSTIRGPLERGRFSNVALQILACSSPVKALEGLGLANTGSDMARRSWPMRRPRMRARAPGPPHHLALIGEPDIMRTILRFESPREMSRC